MKITFGMFLDGRQWSEKSASLGEIVCGPAAFLTLLEQRTGLAGIGTVPPERINEYRAKIEAVAPEWCRASFQLDSWSTAKQMLALRDELYLNGWNGTDAPSKRLKALAAIEKNLLPLSPGVPERIKRLLVELEFFTFSDTLYLHSDFEQLPFHWKKIIEQLKKCGMQIIASPPEKPSQPEVIKVTGRTEYALATEVARFLSAGNNKSVALICEGKSEALDGVLHRFGKGMIGNVQPSRWRESLQILPLWLETLWKPFTPLRFLELLTLPNSPVPGTVARKLVKALQQAPGIGGEAWELAWQSTLEDIRENKHGFYKDVEAECKKISELQTFLETECFKYDSNTGVPEDVLIKRCEYLEKRLAPKIEKYPELAIPVSHTGTLKKISSGKGIISQVALARMLDSIISTGTAPRRDNRQVTDFSVFTHPGAVTGNFDTVLWWNCIDNGQSKSVYWTADEIKVMPGFDHSNARKLENNAWQRAKNAAQKEFIAFIPQIIDGEPVFPHALLDAPNIAAIEDLPSEKLINSEGTWQLGSRQKSLPPRNQFFPKNTPFAQKNTISPLKGLSYSQLNTLLSCPLQWLFKYYLALQTPPSMNLPTGAKMLGTLAHKVVETLYAGREKISASDAANDAGVIFDKLVPAMAAELLQDGRSVERKRIRETLVNSIVSLVKEINLRKLQVKSCEKRLDGSFNGIDFIGFCDLYLETEEGRPFVIDMKWSTLSCYEKNLKDNKALQLAVYSWLLSPENMNVLCAYYLFPKQSFICKPHADWKSLWQNACLCWTQRMEALQTGILQKGTDDEKALKNSTLPLPLSASCKFCDYAVLCEIVEE